MMSWPGPAFTPVNIPPVPDRIRYTDCIVMIGSCFAEHIANRLEQYKYAIYQNPFGILYNPVSLAESIRRIVEQKYYSSDELIFHDGLYHSMDHHGSFSGVNKEEVLDGINQAIVSAHHHLTKSKFIFISPGTSWVYRYKTTGHVAGNCHKIPQAHFEKSMLTIEESHDAFERMYGWIKKISPAAHVIWTISPVRHIRDGLVDNQRSKSALILAAAGMIKKYSDCIYFPAYEIMIDQLRDYRYYAKDLVHPSEAAIDIIWEIFCEHYIDQNELKVQALIEKLHQGMNHRFLHARTDDINDFAKAQLDLVDRIRHLVANLDLSKETRYFTSLLKP